jgi:DNA-directed RNA polymerase specialized sigma24 family protein
MRENGQMPEWHPDDYLPLLRLQVRKMHLNPRFRRLFDSMDLVMEAYVKVLKYRENGNPPPAAPGQRVKWLQTILRNTVIDLLRKHKQELLIPLVRGFLSQSSVRLEEHIEAGGRANRIKLPPNCSRAVDFVKGSGLRFSPE